MCARNSLPEEAPMHLASDYIHPYEAAGGRPAYCRVHIYLPDETVESPVMKVLWDRGCGVAPEEGQG